MEGNERIQRTIDGMQCDAALARMVCRQRAAPIGGKSCSQGEVLLGMREDMQLPGPLARKKGQGKNEAEQ